MQQQRCHLLASYIKNRLNETVSELPKQVIKAHYTRMFWMLWPVVLISPSPLRHISLVASEKMVTGFRPSTCLITGSWPTRPSSCTRFIAGVKEEEPCLSEAWLNLSLWMRELYSHLSKMRLVSVLLYLTSCLNSWRQRKNSYLKQFLGQIFEEGQKVMITFEEYIILTLESFD